MMKDLGFIDIVVPYSLYYEKGYYSRWIYYAI